MIYFRAVYFFMVARHALQLREKSTVMDLTAVLQYFANVIGERVNTVRFGNLAASNYLLNL